MVDVGTTQSERPNQEGCHLVASDRRIRAKPRVCRRVTPASDPRFGYRIDLRSKLAIAVIFEEVFIDEREFKGPDEERRHLPSRHEQVRTKERVRRRIAATGDSLFRQPFGIRFEEMTRNIS